MTAINYKKLGECHVNLNGHKSGVTTLSFDSDGHRLASGAKDTCIIIWDVVNECGLYRLKAHKSPITRVSFMKSRPNILVSSSKDTYVKFWDLSYQHCFKTLAGHVTEVWDFDLIKNDTILVSHQIRFS
jgi:U3 small nucleolar RNA-associated protein 12